MIKTERTYQEKTVNRGYKLLEHKHFDTFSVKVFVGNLIVVDHSELMIDSPCHATKEKYIKRLTEQREILANVGITDDASANAYLDKLEPQLEAWAKLKETFDKETEARLRHLQAEFLQQHLPTPAQFPSAEA